MDKPKRLPQTLNWENTQAIVQFSPTSPTQDWSSTTNGLIGKTLERATSSIDLALFVFSDQKLANILESLHQRVLWPLMRFLLQKR